MAVVEIGLGDDPGVGQIRHVDAGEVLGRRLVGHVEDAPAVGGLVQVHALADVIVSLEIDVGNQFHVPGFSRLGRHEVPPAPVGAPSSFALDAWAAVYHRAPHNPCQTCTIPASHHAYPVCHREERSDVAISLN